MKNFSSPVPKSFQRIVAASILLALPGVVRAESWMLVGVSGAQQSSFTDASGNFLFPDHTLFQINYRKGTANPIMLLPWVHDSQAMGYCPTNGLIYHTAGCEAYRDNPGSNGHDQDGVLVPGTAYQDSQYMEAINLATRAITPIFNADPCPNPDPTLPCYALPAPRPSWSVPAYRRDSTQTDSTNRITGTNEYHAARGLAWSSAKNAFYLSDDAGIFKMTAAGDCTFLGRPKFPIDNAANQSKAIAFVTVNGTNQLWIGHRDGNGTNGYIIRVDPDNVTNVISQLALNFPPGGGDPVDEFGGLLGLAQHPVTGVIYGLRKGSDNFNRELVTIDPATGDTTLVGGMGMHITSMAFVPDGWKLVGVTGAQTDTQTGPNGFLYPDHTLFEVNHNSAFASEMLLLPWANDSQAMGYCPTNDLVYHAGGSEAYSNNALRNGHDQDGVLVPGTGYQDSQWMESVNLKTHALTGIFNADPCPNPDPTLPCYGLPAPVPSWILPAYRRDSSQTDGTNRVSGPNEYHAARGLAWSTNKNLFYVSDEKGIFKLTTTGDCTILTNRPGFVMPSDFGDVTDFDEAKAIAFLSISNTTLLAVGSRMENNPSGNTNGWIMYVDPDTGTNMGQLALSYPPGGADPVDRFSGLLALAQHPLTGVIYGMRKTSDAFSRELVTINPNTGETKLVGTIGMHVTSFAFVPAPALRIDSITRSGSNMIITWSGGTPRYQLQSRSSLTSGSWTDVGTSTTALTATVPMSGPQMFYRVIGQ